MSEGNNNCAICGTIQALAECAGCGKPLCAECSCFELIASGCGTVWPAWFCRECARDRLINPNAELRDPG